MSQSYLPHRSAEGALLLPRPAGTPERWKRNTRVDRDRIRRCYDGAAGVLLRIGSLFSLHEPLVGQLISGGTFALKGRRSILDIGVGAGQILRHVLAGADRDARVTAIDLSTQMLRRTRRGLGTDRPSLLAADIVHLPFADAAFDCITCGWVLEYQSDPRPALSELRRVLEPGGNLLILATDDTFAGRLVGRLWSCRTFTAEILQEACRDVGLDWRRRYWLSPVHRALGAGGILFEAARPRTVA